MALLLPWGPSYIRRTVTFPKQMESIARMTAQQNTTCNQPTCHLFPRAIFIYFTGGQRKEFHGVLFLV